jgi:predicted ATP-grasp superfamily ATP-dependent carboligase
LAEHLVSRGVPVPPGITLSGGARLPEDFPYPAVLKPRFGAGSLGVERIERWDASCVPAVDASRGVNHTEGWRLEPFCDGLAASVVCLCGPRQCVALEPCRQTLSNDGRLNYLGGSVPLAPALAERARRLALRAVQALGRARGSIGVDLILGADAAGRDDVVIEINPRLTTSYVGLRRLAEGNLAETLLAIAFGRRGEVGWQQGSVAFDAAGHVQFRRAERAKDGGPISDQEHSRADDELAVPPSV